MGRVLAAFDTVLERDVALKILLPGANADRFVRESKITARLPHPGIPPVHALGSLTDGSPFLAMKLIAGTTLAEEIKAAEPGAPGLLQVFTQVCHAVGFAHSRGVIHRDLKPANVMVGAFGEVQVMDWGLAKDLSSQEAEIPRSTAASPEGTVAADQGRTITHHPAGESTDDQTQAGAILGTPAYMAPEQARGESCDARADVFALGGILCAILTGKPPFAGTSSLEIIRRAGAADMVEANRRLENCGADPELLALCRRCLSPAPRDRPIDAREVAARLTTYLVGVQDRLQAAERERAVARTQELEQRKRRRVQLALACTVVLLMLGSGAVAWWQERQVSDRRATEARLQGERKAEQSFKEKQARQGVAANLELAADLRQQYKFDEADKALAQAADLAKGGAPDRLAEVEQARSDLALVVQLDRIRFGKWIWRSEQGKGKFNLSIAAPEYRQAFRSHGMDLLVLEPVEAAKRIEASGIKAEMIAAVDDWSLHEPESSVRDRLLEVARRAEPDPWADRLRDVAARTDRSLVEKLAAELPAGVSAAKLIMLSELMARQGLNPIPMLTTARTAFPAEFELAFALGLLHDAHQDSQSAGPYEAARALRPENTAAWINLGNRFLEDGRLDQALVCYQKVIELDSKQPAAHVNLGQTLARLGRLDEAIACYRKALELDPDYAGVHNSLGSVLDDKGQVDEAIACYQKAIALDPRLATAHYNLGNSLTEQGRVDEALASYQRAIELDANFAAAYTNQGNLLYQTGRVDLALASYRKAVEVDPGLATAHYSIGLVLAGQGQLEQAMTCYREAIRLNPEYAEAHCNLGALLRLRGDFVGALEQYRKGHELGTRKPGWRYPSADWLARAETELALSIKLPGVLRGDDQPADNAQRVALARIATSQGQFAAATRLYAEALEIDPTLGDDRRAGCRYEAARTASRAAAGHGQGELPLDDTAKSQLRAQCRDWLRAELTSWEKILELGAPQARPVIMQILNAWREETDLAEIRDLRALEKLPADERAAFTQLWNDVAELVRRVQSAEAKP